MSLNTTNISLATFKTITNSNGQFATWSDIINTAMEALPVNDEIFNVPFKSMEEVGIGDNVMWEVADTKTVEYLRTELDKNNTLNLNKFNMVLYEDYMTSYEWDIRDMKSAQSWSAIIANCIKQMFITKQDIGNALAADEIMKVALAIGNFTIIPNAQKDAWDLKLPDNAFLPVGRKVRRILNAYRTKRTKFARGIDVNRLKWVNGYNFSMNLLSAQTANFSASNDAYRDIKEKNVMRNFLGTEYTESMYLGVKFDMNEFTPTAGDNTGQKQNEGSFTGNLTKPYFLENVFSIGWLPESVKYYGHNFTNTEVPAVNDRFKKVETFAWRQQVCIDPVFAGFNHIFLDAMPSFPSYTKVNGDVVEALNLSNWTDYIKFTKKLRAEQPMVYDALITSDGYGIAGVKNDGQYTQYITDNTMKILGEPAKKERKK